jgi:hypothetical protein
MEQKSFRREQNHGTAGVRRDCEGRIELTNEIIFLPTSYAAGQPEFQP